MSIGTITIREDKYILEFPYRPKIVAAVKLIPGSRYIGSAWTLPKSDAFNIESFARRFNFSFSDQVQRPEVVGDIPPMPELTIDIPLKLELYPYQKQGVQYILNKKRVIVADEPGLGKTGQAIAAVIAANAFPCIVICPASLKENWAREITKWSNKKALILNDACKNTLPLYWQKGVADFFITNYESLKKYFVKSIDDVDRVQLKHIDFKEHVDMFKSVIIDELHRCKNGSTLQAKFTKGVAWDKEYVIGLTGTPVVNRPSDLWSQLHVISQLKVFGSWKGFMDRYCSGAKQASYLKELNYKLNLNCFYRRNKKDVLKDLPAKTRQILVCDITTRKEYDDALASLEQYLRQYKEASSADVARAMRGEVMVRIGVLKNISARGKLDALYEYIDDLMEAGEKLVLFCYLKEVVHAIKRRYQDAVSITGEDSQESRERAKHEFQKCKTCGIRLEDHKDANHDHVPSDTKLIVMNYKSGGVGHTLTASSRMAFVEYPWTPSDCEQCEDRCHRISAVYNVSCTYLMGRNTIDEWMYYEVIAAKRDTANIITGAENDVDEIIIDKMWNLFNQNKLQL